MPDFRSLSDVHVLQHQSLDGYLWLRYLKTLCLICLVGCFLTWPILFPVNATGGGGQSQLDILSFSNIAKPNRYYAHALVSWVFMGMSAQLLRENVHTLTLTGFVIFMVTRERVFFIGLRQAYFLSSFHAQRLSSRTVLFMGIPKDSLTEAQLRSTFGRHVRKIWMVPDCNDLEELVENRNKLWTKFEGGEQKLILDANKKKMKSKSDQTESDPFKYVDKRPTHKLKMIIGKKVDTIEYGRTEIPKMNQEIEQKQTAALDGKSKMMSAAFVEFNSQAAAQEAYQIAAHSKKTTWHPRYIGVQPGEVIWKNLGVSVASRKTKMLIATVIIVVMTIFWAVPVAFVGVLTNINYLTNKVPFLSFITKIPSVILGVVTGLLPTILLAVLMALVPIICRCKYTTFVR